MISLIRAVTLCTSVVTAVTAAHPTQDLYNPSRHDRAGTGTVEVSPAK